MPYKENLANARERARTKTLSSHSIVLLADTVFAQYYLSCRHCLRTS